MHTWIKDIADGVEITLKVVPGASRSRIAGPLGDALKVQVGAVAEKGKANAAIIALLAERLNVASNQIEIVRGTTNPHKTIHVRGLTAGVAIDALLGT